MRYICANVNSIICIPMREKKEKKFRPKQLKKNSKKKQTNKKSVHLNLNRRQKQLTHTLFARFLFIMAMSDYSLTF